MPSLKIPGNLDSGKFILLVLLVLAVLYGPGLFKNGFQSTPTYFKLRKVTDFKINPNPEKTFFATDVVAIGTDELAVTDQPGGQVLIYDLKGNLVRLWGKIGKGPKQFSEPSGITSDRNGHLFVMDTWNGAIKEFDVKGKLLKVLDLSRFGNFYGPRQVRWGGDSLLIPNPANSILGRLSLSDELLNVWHGDDIGKVISAIGDGKGHYYVGDSNEKKSRVQVIDETGKPIQTIKSGIPASTMALDSKGRLFVSCYGEATRVFDKTGNLLGNVVDEAQPTGVLGQWMGMDITPDGLIIGCAGDLVSIYRVAEDK
jgi:hypothetical protein